MYLEGDYVLRIADWERFGIVPSSVLVTFEICGTKSIPSQGRSFCAETNRESGIMPGSRDLYLSKLVHDMVIAVA